MTGDRRTVGLPVRSRVPHNASMWMLVSKKASIEVFGAYGSSGDTHHTVRTQLLLFLAQQ